MKKCSQARIAANARYNAKAYDIITIRKPRGTRERWKDAAAARGLSLAALIVEAVEKYISAAPLPDCQDVGDATPRARLQGVSDREGANRDL